MSGIRQRGSGVDIDLRRDYEYEGYTPLYFFATLAPTGDCFDRYFLRVEERRQTLSLIHQIANYIPGGLVKASSFKLFTHSRAESKRNRQGLISHFHLHSGGYRIAPGESYVCVEAPKGEFGRFTSANDSARAYRTKFKAPGYSHLQGLDFRTQAHLIADVVAAIGSQDIVFGEVDR